MALKLGKASGGVLTVTPADGVTSTDLVLPLSGTVATEAYADGKTTLTQVKAEISTGSNLVTSPTGGLGYGTGSGGTVTQLTSKSTTVTLNKPTGQIIMNNASLSSGAIVQFNLLNSLITPTDCIEVTLRQSSSTVPTLVELTWAVENGLIQIGVRNNHSVALGEAFVLNFTIIKGTNS